MNKKLSSYKKFSFSNKDKIMKYKLLIFIVFIFFLFSQQLPVSAEEETGTDSPPPASTTIHGKLTLAHAVVCEDVKDMEPFNSAIVFSIAIGKISCFTTFVQIPEKTVIYHNWYRADKLGTKIKLNLNSPSWSTYSSIQLRETDKGPWRVEITDKDGNIFQILRFSITE